MTMTYEEKINELTERREHSDTMKFDASDAYLLESLEMHRDSLTVEEREFWLAQEF